MTLEFSPWVALVLGILIGWLFGWFLDLWFDRRRELEYERRRAELEELQRLREIELTPAVAPVTTSVVSEAAIEEEPLPPLSQTHALEDAESGVDEVRVVDTDREVAGEVEDEADRADSW